jgi:hypothetical protein
LRVGRSFQLGGRTIKVERAHQRVSERGEVGGEMGKQRPKRWRTSGYPLTESGMKEEQRVMNLRHGAAGR